MTFHPVLPQQILNQEAIWDKSKTILSKTDANGTIIYMNDTFEKVSEYLKIELLGESHHILKHPDMPKVILRELQKNLEKGKNFNAVLKNITRSGKYYWVVTDFITEKNNEGKITGYQCIRKSVSNTVINQIEPFYKKLLAIESTQGKVASQTFFNSYLKNEIGKTYNEYVNDLLRKEQPKQYLRKESNWFPLKYIKSYCN